MTTEKGFEFYRSLIMSDIKVSLSNANRNTYSGQTVTDIVIHSSLFLTLFKLSWRGDNGERLIFKKTGPGGFSTYLKGGQCPPMYIWDTFNNGKEFIGYNRKHYYRIYKFHVSRSPKTFNVKVWWYIARQQKHSTIWVK